MKKRLVLFFLFCAAGLFAQELHWMKTFDEALAAAVKEKKPLFLYFNGSDWCGWCIRLNSEVLAKKEMIRFLNDNFILYRADFPRQNPPPAEIRKKNNQLLEFYRVEGFPTIVIANSYGKMLGITGYIPGGPAAMIKDLKRYVHRKPGPGPGEKLF